MQTRPLHRKARGFLKDDFCNASSSSWTLLGHLLKPVQRVIDRGGLARQRAIRVGGLFLDAVADCVEYV